MKKLKNKAFTLIELLIVISVISLLSTVIMYSTSEAKMKADDAHMIVESDQVSKAIQLYKDDNGGRAPVSASYSSSKGTMVTEGSVQYKESMEKLVEEGYLPEVPTSPNGSSYSYLVSEDEKDAVFAASLNLPSSSSGSNSCDAIGDGDIEYNSCSYGSYGSFSSEYPYEWVEVVNYSGDAYSLDACVFDSNWNPLNLDCLYQDDSSYPDSVVLNMSSELCAQNIGDGSECFILTSEILNNNCTLVQEDQTAYSKNPQSFPDEVCDYNVICLTDTGYGNTTTCSFDSYNRDYAVCEIANEGPICSGGVLILTTALVSKKW